VWTHLLLVADGAVGRWGCARGTDDISNCSMRKFHPHFFSSRRDDRSSDLQGTAEETLRMMGGSERLKRKLTGQEGTESDWQRGRGRRALRRPRPIRYDNVSPPHKKPFLFLIITGNSHEYHLPLVRCCMCLVSEIDHESRVSQGGPCHVFCPRRDAHPPTTLLSLRHSRPRSSFINQSVPAGSFSRRRAVSPYKLSARQKRTQSGGEGLSPFCSCRLARQEGRVVCCDASHQSTRVM
jgi:hypothetical protein